MTRMPQHKTARVWTPLKQDEFETMYSVDKLPIGEISKRLDVPISGLENRIKKLGMKRTG